MSERVVPMATCPNPDCGTPLVGTFAWSGFEWLCLGCGRLVTYFGAQPADPTPELDARYEVLKDEWAEIAPSLIRGGVMLRTCETCTSKHEPHWEHATEAEKAKDQVARAALRERFAEGATA